MFSILSRLQPLQVCLGIAIVILFGTTTYYKSLVKELNTELNLINANNTILKSENTAALEKISLQNSKIKALQMTQIEVNKLQDELEHLQSSYNDINKEIAKKVNESTSPNEKLEYVNVLLKKFSDSM